MRSEVIQDGMGNYLKISEPGDRNYSDNVFSYQDIPGFLPLELRRINGQKEYIYNISGRISLKKYLDRGDFARNDIERLFRQLFAMTDCVEEYLLDSRGIVMGEDYLYLDPATGTWEGIYYGKNEMGIAEAIGGLLEFIMEKMDQKDRELVFFVYGMHKLTRGADCTRDLLARYIQEARLQIPDRTEPAISSPPPTPCHPAGRGHLHPERKRVIRPHLLPGLILAVGMAVPAALWQMGFFRLPLSGGTDWGKVAGAVAFFLAVSGYGAWKTMPGAGAKRERNDILFHDEEKEQSKVCLIPQTGAGEILPIPHFPFRIGGKVGSGQANVNILQEAGIVMVMDEESGEETYHNGRRLAAWQKIPVEDGDLLRIGRHEYVVEITKERFG